MNDQRSSRQSARKKPPKHQIRSRCVDTNNYDPSEDKLTDHKFEFGKMLTELEVYHNSYSPQFNEKGRTYDESYIVVESRYVHGPGDYGKLWVESKGERAGSRFYHSSRCTDGDCLGWRGDKLQQKEEAELETDLSWELELRERTNEQGEKVMTCNPSGDRLSQIRTRTKALDDWFTNQISRTESGAKSGSSLGGEEPRFSKAYLGYHQIRPRHSVIEPFSTFWQEYTLPDVSNGNSGAAGQSTEQSTSAASSTNPDASKGVSDGANTNTADTAPTS